MDLSYAGHKCDFTHKPVMLTYKTHSTSRVNTFYRDAEINGKLEAGWAPEPGWTLWRGEKSLAPIYNRTDYAIMPLVCRFSLLIHANAVAQLVEALRYKSEGRGFDSRWCHWNFSLT